MTKITGTEPKHWHDEHGQHRMPDPRHYAKPQPLASGGMSSGVSKATVCHGDSDLAAYWDHLNEHDQLSVVPERQDDDSAQIASLFDLIEANDRKNATLRAMITALRNA